MNEDKLAYLKDNITLINASNFKLEDTDNGVELFGSITNLKQELSYYFTEQLNDAEFKSKILKSFEDENFTRSKIKLIANKHLCYKKDLENFFDAFIQYDSLSLINRSEYVDNSLKFVQSKINNDNKFRFIKNNIKKYLEKQFHFIGKSGFSTNILNINSGIMTANAGDSAQFLFLARAILAGFNCSNVDVRSSRYDAVIDYNNKVLRVQVKGISGNSLSFKDRDRGGQGIDHNHERNKGKKITSKDCDLYVAVDKDNGTCYLIPMKKFVDPLHEQNTVKVNITEVEKFKEDWNIIKELTM